MLPRKFPRRRLRRQTLICRMGRPTSARAAYAAARNRRRRGRRRRTYCAGCGSSCKQWNQACGECQQAVNLNSKNSDYLMWLGRALGQQASHASFLSAYGDAKKSLAEMQTAVQLNPQNGPALSDLGDYYAQAPSIAGGGTSKAQQLPRSSTRWTQREQRNCGATSPWRQGLHHGRNRNTNRRRRRVQIRLTIGRSWRIFIVAASAGPIWMRRFRIA